MLLKRKELSVTKQICLEGEGSFRFLPFLDCIASPRAPDKEGSPGLGCLCQGENYHHSSPPWAPLSNEGLSCVMNFPVLQDIPAAEMGPFQCPNLLLHCEPWEQQHKCVLTEMSQVPSSKKDCPAKSKKGIALLLY